MQGFVVEMRKLWRGFGSRDCNGHIVHYFGHLAVDKSLQSRHDLVRPARTTPSSQQDCVQGSFLIDLAIVWEPL